MRRKLRIHLIAAARPNFMKIAPWYHALQKSDWATPLVVHTGQHYDLNMSDAFFQDLMLPAPHHHLGVGSGSHAEQTGKVMIAYERLLTEQRPELVVVVGDVNSTVACALAAVKLGVKTAHLEAGLRSFDRSMPEEINRIVTDAIADLLWTPSADVDENLRREGVSAAKIERVGNIMIDSLEMMRPRIMAESAAAKYGLQNGAYGVVTLQRPSNVDSPEVLETLCSALARIASRLPLIFPVHPRTRKNLDEFRALWAPGGGARHAPGLAGQLHFVHEPGVQLPPGDHRLGRHPGGDDRARRALPHDAREHGASGHGRRSRRASSGGHF